MKHVAFAEAEIQKSPLDRARGPLKKLFNIWLQRTNTPMGRTAVLKSLILSKLIYLWILLPNPPNQVLKKLQHDIFDFIWDKKRDKIKRTIAIRQIKEGGINVPNVEVYVKSLKLTWMKKLVKENPPKWKVILLKQYPEETDINKHGSALFLGKTS